MYGWILGFALGLALTGCKTDQDHGEIERTDKPMPERIDDKDRPAAPVTGEVPSRLLDAIKADLAGRASASADDIAVVRAEAVVWRDGSLGCPEPGMMYTQALVDGYWVVLELDGRQYDYRAGSREHFSLCTGRGTPPLRGDPRT